MKSSMKLERRLSHYREVELFQVTFPEGDVHYSSEIQGKEVTVSKVYFSPGNSYHWFVEGKELNSYERDYVANNAFKISNRRKKSRKTQQNI